MNEKKSAKSFKKTKNVVKSSQTKKIARKLTHNEKHGLHNEKKNISKREKSTKKSSK